MEGERIVFIVSRSVVRSDEQLVAIASNGLVRGVGDVNDPNCTAFVDHDEIVYLFLMRGDNLIPCLHDFDDIPADRLWGIDRIVIGAPLRCRRGRKKYLNEIVDKHRRMKIGL